MNKNILFSLALCAGLLLPQGFFASQSWSEWGMQGLRSAAQTAYSYLPSGSSLSSWAASLVSGMSDEQKNYLRLALGMGAVTAAGAAGYYYTQHQQELSQEVERLRKELELDKDFGNSSMADTVGKIAFFYKPGRESIQDKALEKIFKEDICSYLKKLEVSLAVFIDDVLKQTKKTFRTYSWAASFDMKLLKSLKAILEKTECDHKGLIHFLNSETKNIIEKDKIKVIQEIDETVSVVDEGEEEKKEISDLENSLTQNQADIVKSSAQSEPKGATRTVLSAVEKAEMLELLRKKLQAKIDAGKGDIGEFMRKELADEASVGADGKALIVHVVATIIVNLLRGENFIIRGDFLDYFNENVGFVFYNKLFEEDQFNFDFMKDLMSKIDEFGKNLHITSVVQELLILLYFFNHEISYFEKYLKRVELVRY